MKILLTNVCDLYNKGEVTLVTTIANNLPNSEIMIAPIFSFINRELCVRLKIKVFGRISPLPKPLLLLWSVALVLRAALWSAFKKAFNINLAFLLSRELQAYSKADLIIDLGGDTFSDDYGVFSTCIHCYSLFLGFLFNKPYFICSQSIGPFKNSFTRFLAKATLQRAEMITVREPITMRYLLNDLKMNPSNRLRIVYDLAFLLESAETEATRNLLKQRGIMFDGHPIIGVNPSNLIWRYMFPGLSLGEKYELYTRLMATIIDSFPEDIFVLLIPNVTGRPLQSSHYKNVDDRNVIPSIVKKLNNPSRVHLIDENYDPHQIKSIIGLTDLFVGCRMHAVISSLSIGTPTIALSYSHKTIGIIGELLGFDEIIVNVRNRDNPEVVCSELLSKINYAWNRRQIIAEMLAKKRPDWRKQALANIGIVEQLCTINTANEPQTRQYPV